MNLLRLVWRIIKWLAAGTLLLLILVCGYYLYPVIPDPESRFVERKGQLASAQLTREKTQAGAIYKEYTLRSTSGLTVDISVRLPGSMNAPLPLVVLLGGYGTGRHATELITRPVDMVVASLSYPYGGDRRMQGVGLLKNIRHIQNAMLDITPATLLTLEFLLQQPYVDQHQIELVGVSLGAFFATIPAALDQRIHRLWLVQGAGDPKAIFAYRMESNIKSVWWRDKLAAVIALIANVHHLTPEYWTARVSPRPIVVINSRADPTFPEQSVKVLHQSLREPYEVIWLEGGHVKPSEKGIIKQLSDVVFERIASGN